MYFKNTISFVPPHKNRNTKKRIRVNSPLLPQRASVQPQLVSKQLPGRDAHAHAPADPHISSEGDHFLLALEQAQEAPNAPYKETVFGVLKAVCLLFPFEDQLPSERLLTPPPPPPTLTRSVKVLLAVTEIDSAGYGH